MKEESAFQVEEFRVLLVQWRGQLLDVADTAREGAKVVELDQSKVGRLSRMDALQGQAMSQEAQRRRGIKLQKIAAALKRIDEDEYGYCLRCGEFIGLGRLRVNPAAPLCVRCAD